MTRNVRASDALRSAGVAAEILEEQLDAMQDNIFYRNNPRVAPKENVATVNSRAVLITLQELKDMKNPAYDFYRSMFAQLLPEFLAPEYT